MISPVSSSINLFTPLLGHHPMVTSLLNQRKVIIPPMKDGNGKRTFALGPIVTMSCHPWDSNAKNQTNRIPCSKTLPFLVSLASKLHGNQLQAQVAPNEPYKPNEPSIPGQSQPLEPHEPEPEVAPMQSTEEPFAHPTTPTSIIIIYDTPVGSPLPPVLPWFLPKRFPLAPSSPQSHDDAWQ
ncbi:hypothetical protein O181_011027 [Austropuccinia psidii MF-1]|uniref:Uncharacterized protein n=1 Tax=Austropuccinia psidii MF-1 TaxID=1389203 RepID=A0A9Q3GLR5_9BASI|nr:hypothetical protein [Austropuccinia psidii MF-1]